MPDIYEGNNRRITSTSQAAKGSILFGTSAYDEAENRMGIGTDEPSVELEVVGDILAEDVVADGIQVEAITLTTGASAGHVLTSDADGVATWTAIPAQDHGALTGLADDDHNQYAACDGRAGGQSLTGGTEDGDGLTLQSTAGAVKGSILFGASAYDEVNDRLGIGTAAPAVALDVVGDGAITGNLDVAGTITSAGFISPQATVSLSAADLIGMSVAPVELVAAPGEGKALVFLGLVANVTRTETGFTGGGAVSVKYAGGADVMATIAASVLTGAAGQTISRRIPADLSDLALANVENKALVLTNADAPFGDGTGTAEVTVLYATVDV